MYAMTRASSKRRKCTPSDDSLTNSYSRAFFLEGPSAAVTRSSRFPSPTERSALRVRGTSMRGVCSKRSSRVCQKTTTVGIQLARVLTNIDDEFEMSRRHEPTVTRTTEQKDPSSHGPHNERARGARHEDVASLVPACSGARVCHEQGCGIGREVPTDHEALGQENAATAARVRSRRRVTSNSREGQCLMNQRTSTAEQGHGAR